MMRTVVAAVEDMLFVSKIREAAKAVGIIVNFPRSAEVLLDSISEDPPNLLVVDLHSVRFNAIELAGELKSNESLKTIPLLGFFSHVQTELQRQAIEAGYDQVIPRSVFFRDLASILAGEQQKPDR
jgi:PleD family two-component response regulator